MSYLVDVATKAEKHILRMPEPDRQKVRQAIDGLADDPRPHGCLKMQGFDNRWRIAVGRRWRIVYSIWDRQLLVEIVDVDDRKDIYRK